MGAEDVNKLDLEQEEKRLKRMLRSESGRKALENVLNLKIRHMSKDEAEAAQKLPVVAVLVPSHHAPKPQMTDAYAAMVRETKGHAIVVPRPAIASSVVHWVRNNLLKELYESGQEFTHVLFIDDDIAPPPDALVKMLAANVDVVGGACTVRQDPPHPNFRLFYEDEMVFRTAFDWNGEGLLEVGAVGTGLFLISKHALEQVGEYYLSAQHERRFLGATKEAADEIEKNRRARHAEKHDAWWFEFLKHPKGDGEYGEDISFCFKARQMGLKVYVDTSVQPTHWGDYGYGIQDYYKYRDQVIAAQEEHKQKQQSKIMLVD